MVQKLMGRVEFGVREVLRSNDGSSAKVIQAVAPELFAGVETGRYEVDGESVVCLSTQIGCAMACTFCKSTGPFLFPGEVKERRLFGNLNAAQILVQALWGLKAVPIPANSRGVVWSFMGSGEPLANYDEVALAIRGLGEMWRPSRATICTTGFSLERIKQLGKDITSGRFPISVKLHISLHGSTDEQRIRLIPMAKPLVETIVAAEDFATETETKVKLNYVLVGGKNDTSDDAERLGKLLRGRRGLILKISDLNTAALEDKVTPSDAEEFERRVRGYEVQTTRFASHGLDINAGCGQFLDQFHVRHRG